MRYAVYADVSQTKGILCGRPYPREDHLDAFGYATREAAQQRADALKALFPDNNYYAKELS